MNPPPGALTSCARMAIRVEKGSVPFEEGRAGRAGCNTSRKF